MPITRRKSSPRRACERTRPPMSPTSLVEALAGHHEAHLRWLRGRTHGRLAPDEVEDALQAAYARALTALSAAEPERVHFPGPEQATAWLRTIALNVAHDVVRQRRGRSGDGRIPRPPHVSLDDAACARLVADVDVESEAVGAVVRESYRRAVVEAIARMDDRHRQILQLRYGRDLPPSTIMVLVGLDRRQWDGRHTRALKAFGRSLARVSVTRDCRRTRTLLKDSPASLLQRGRGEAGDHVASCLPCSAFANAARFAMSALPLPLAIEAWRLDAVEVLAPPAPRPSAAGSRGALEAEPPGDATVAVQAASPALAAAAGVMAAVAAMFVSGLVVGAPLEAAPEAPETGPARSARLVTHPGTRLAGHLTPRQALERAARESGRRRARSARRAGGVGGSKDRRVRDPNTR